VSTGTDLKQLLRHGRMKAEFLDSLGLEQAASYMRELADALEERLVKKGPYEPNRNDADRDRAAADAGAAGHLSVGEDSPDLPEPGQNDLRVRVGHSRREGSTDPVAVHQLIADLVDSLEYVDRYHPARTGGYGVRVIRIAAAKRFLKEGLIPDVSEVR
jgi:hypothetical protein